MGIVTGKIHNPSARIDPHYWRLYVSARSYRELIELIGGPGTEKTSHFARPLDGPWETLSFKAPELCACRRLGALAVSLLSSAR